VHEHVDRAFGGCKHEGRAVICVALRLELRKQLAFLSVDEADQRPVLLEESWTLVCHLGPLGHGPVCEAVEIATIDGILKYTELV
jgi:hypothetical protein